MFGGACMSEKLDFYEVNIDYVKYLKQFDSRIPDVVYQNRNKFVCGTLFKINGLNFFAPVSSFNTMKMKKENPKRRKKSCNFSPI